MPEDAQRWVVPGRKNCGAQEHERRPPGCRPAGVQSVPVGPEGRSHFGGCKNLRWQETCTFDRVVHSIREKANSVLTQRMIMSE